MIVYPQVSHTVLAVLIGLIVIGTVGYAVLVFIALLKWDGRPGSETQGMKTRKVPVCHRCKRVYCICPRRYR